MAIIKGGTDEQQAQLNAERLEALARWCAVRVVDKEFSLRGIANSVIANMVLNQMEAISGTPTFPAAMERIMEARHAVAAPADKIRHPNLKAGLASILSDVANDARIQAIRAHIDKIPVAKPVPVAPKRITLEAKRLEEPRWNTLKSAEVIRTMHEVVENGVSAVPPSHSQFLIRIFPLCQFARYSDEAIAELLTGKKDAGWVVRFRAEDSHETVTRQQVFEFVKTVLPKIEKSLSSPGSRGTKKTGWVEATVPVPGGKARGGVE